MTRSAWRRCGGALQLHDSDDKHHRLDLHDPHDLHDLLHPAVSDDVCLTARPTWRRAVPSRGTERAPRLGGLSRHAEWTGP